MIGRREFIAGLGSAAAWPVVARAQQPAVPVIGWLNVPAAPRTIEPVLPAFSLGLADTGYVVGRNVTIDFREGSIEQMPALAADLVRRQVTVILAVGLTATRAAKAATQTIPIVFAMAFDPVESGVVASLNRPSGNLTGVTTVGFELTRKRLELLHKLVPAADPIAYLARIRGALDANLETAARVLGVRLLPLDAATESEVAAALATIVEQRAGALLLAAGAISLRYLIKSYRSRVAMPSRLYFSTATEL
jgi:putative ABC transport system substrate-binding protein